MEKRESSYIVGGNVNCYSHYGEQNAAAKSLQSCPTLLSPCPVFPLDLCSWPVLMASSVVASSMGTSAYHGGPACGGGSWGSTMSLCLVGLGEHNGSGPVLEPRHLFPAPCPVPTG